MASIAPARPRRRAPWRRHGAAVAMLAPFVAVFACFIIWPLVNSAYLSLTDDNGVVAPHFVGLRNFTRLVHDERFLHALRNTAILVVAAVGLSSLLALALALAFRGPRMLDRLMRTVFFLPSVTSTIASMLVWRWIFADDTSGLANTVREWFGLSAVPWLASTHWTIPVMVVIWVWGTAGYQLVIFVAGLNAIPEMYYEAARMDGASSWQQFRHITVPQLRPVTAYVLITGLITGFQTFELVYIMFHGTSIGGVEDSGLLLVPYLYDMGFNKFQLGYASAVALALFVIIFIVSMIQLRASRALRDD
jgi:ABC-type sugar transport system permease subunit